MTNVSPPPPAPDSATPDVTGGRWWRCLFEASEDAQLVCRQDGTVVEANRKAGQLLGLGGDTPFGALDLQTMLTPATARNLTELLQRSGGRTETLAGVSLLCRGQLGMMADLQVVPLGEGCALVIIRDASRRWRMESHVQRLITAINCTSDVAYLTDPEFRLTFVNWAFQNVTGHPLEDSMGRDVAFLRAPTEGGKVAAYRAATASGKDWRDTLVNVRRDGSTYPVDASISPIFDKNGALIGAVGFERDISSQLRLQRDLQVERDYTQSIVNSVDAAIYTVDCDLRLHYTNSSWQRLPSGCGWLSFKEPPQIGRCLLDYIEDESRRNEIRAALQSVLDDGKPREMRGSLGEALYWQVKITPWKHEAGLRGVNYVVIDQTNFCQLQAQLFQAQKMETIGALAAGVAHDFNNLLLAIRGNVTLLQLEESLGQSVLGRLGQIEQAAARATQITQQLLSFSRSNEEKEVVLDFNRLVQEAGHLARRTLKNRVELQLDLPATPIKVRMDSTRATQVLLNLIVNAYDAMPKSGCITISNRLVALSEEQARRADKPAGVEFLCCSVADTGTGIPPEVLSRIFDPFFTTKEKGKGTGLGLAIVHNVISKAGGFVEVETELGQGTTFKICLPTVTTGLTEAPAPVAPGLVKGTGCVLVVDDMDFILDFTRSFLSEAGYEVLVAVSADEALRILEREEGRIQVLITDLNMPGRDGVDLGKEVQRRWPGIKCILASGYLEEEEVKRIQTELQAPILNKPYNVREATDLVSQMLRR